jgi:hypothetical protein
MNYRKAGAFLNRRLVSFYIFFPLGATRIRTKIVEILLFGGRSIRSCIQLRPITPNKSVIMESILMFADSKSFSVRLL